MSVQFSRKKVSNVAAATAELCALLTTHVNTWAVAAPPTTAAPRRDAAQMVVFVRKIKDVSSVFSAAMKHLTTTATAEQQRRVDVVVLHGELNDAQRDAALQKILKPTKQCVVIIATQVAICWFGVVNNSRETIHYDRRL